MTQTIAQEEAAVVAALEAEAATDAGLISTFNTTYGGTSASLQTAANALAIALADPLHQQTAQALANQFGNIVTAYETFLTSVQAAETSPPPA